MARKKAYRDSVYNVRRHHRRWLFGIRDGRTGITHYLSYKSEQEAQRAYRQAIKAIADIQQPLMGDVLQKYQQYLFTKGNKADSTFHTIDRLSKIVDSNAYPVEFTAEKIRIWYKARSAKVAADTHKNELIELRSFFRWAVKNNYMKMNPADGVESIGKRRKGKMQLRPAEAILFLDKALELSAEGKDWAFAAAITLLLGLRPSEVFRLELRDADMASKLLFIEDSKTPTGKRNLKIPEVLWTHIESRKKDKAGVDRSGVELLMPNKEGQPHRREYLNRGVKRILKELNLPNVCAYSLRGLHGTLGIEANGIGLLVSAQLGHASIKTTTSHYIDPATLQQKNQERVVAVLTPSESAEAPVLH